MGFIEAKCKNCGGKITLDENLTKGVCGYCGTEFVKSDVIVNNNYSIENATVVLNNDNLVEQQLINAETYLTELKDYDKALECYLSVTEARANDYRGWWGIVRTLTKEFTFKDNTKKEYQECKRYAENALGLMTDSKKDELKKIWEAYSLEEEERFSREAKEKAELELQLKTAEEKKKKLNTVRRIAADIISVVINLSFVLYICTHDLSVLASNEWLSLTFIGIALAINSAVAVVLELIIGRSPECFIFQALATAAVLINLLFSLLSGISFGFAEIILAVILIVAAILVFIICEIFPYTVFKRIRK